MKDYNVYTNKEKKDIEYRSMETNIKYEQGKTKLEQYVKEQNDLYQWYQDTIQRYNETVFDLPKKCVIF